MSFHTSAGATLGISASLPATDDVGGYTALTYTSINGINSIGAFGKSFSEVTFNPLNDRKTLKYKGSYDNGSIPVDAALDDDDAGQDLLFDALDSDANYAFELKLQNNNARYFTARVMSAAQNPGSVDSMYAVQYQLSLNSDVKFYLWVDGFMSFDGYLLADGYLVSDSELIA